MWDEIASALCLVLVIEGLLPFLSPRTWRELVSRLGAVDDRSLRVTGLVMMILGAVLLSIVR